MDPYGTLCKKQYTSSNCYTESNATVTYQSAERGCHEAGKSCCAVDGLSRRPPQAAHTSLKALPELASRRPHPLAERKRTITESMGQSPHGFYGFYRFYEFFCSADHLHNNRSSLPDQLPALKRSFSVSACSSSTFSTRASQCRASADVPPNT